MFHQNVSLFRAKSKRPFWFEMNVHSPWPKVDFRFPECLQILTKQQGGCCPSPSKEDSRQPRSRHSLEKILHQEVRRVFQIWKKTSLNGPVWVEQKNACDRWPKSEGRYQQNKNSHWRTLNWIRVLEGQWQGNRWSVNHTNFRPKMFEVTLLLVT